MLTHRGIAFTEENAKTTGIDMPASNPVPTLGGSHYTRNSKSEIVLPELTSRPGQATKISKVPILLDSAGSYAIVDELLYRGKIADSMDTLLSLNLLIAECQVVLTSIYWD